MMETTAHRPTIDRRGVFFALAESGVPAHLTAGLSRWICEGMPPGGFLQHVIANDLKESIARADEESLEGLLEIVRFLWMHAPAPCWGSPENLWTWCDARMRGNIEVRAAKGFAKRP